MTDRVRGVGEPSATMRLRDRKSGHGVLGDITNKKEETNKASATAPKGRSKVSIHIRNLIYRGRRLVGVAIDSLMTNKAQ